MNKTLIKIMSLFIVLLMTSTLVNAAEISATVDRNPIPVGESFQFVLDVRGSIDEDPDFSELQKNFRILNTSQSSNFRLINGSITRNKTWTMTLIKEVPGQYIIPAIHFGQDKSDPIKINIITNAVKNNGKQQAEIYLEIEVEPKTAYVQQQIIYTIKLFRRIRITNASLSEPVSENDQAIIIKLGDDRDDRTAINGVAYSVLQRRYAIFPQKSGLLKIAPITFETQIIRNNRQRSFFNADPFNTQGTIKRIKSKAIEVKVKGIPAQFTKKYPNAAWLPVDKLTMTESWSGDIKSFKSGEPMTRTISLTAQNLSAAQLPDVKITSPKNIKTYPDVPVVAEQSNNKGLVANKQFKIALLPTKVGQHTLPKIVIPWWNTQTNKIQEVVIKAETITVSSAINQGEEHQMKIKDDTVSQNINPETSYDEADLKLNPIKITESNNQSSTVWVIACIIFAVLWLITIYLFLSLRKKLNAVTATTENGRVTKAVSSKELKAACLGNDARVCSQLLIQWANTKTDSDRFTNLSSLLPYAEQKLSDAISELEKCRYSNRSEEWSGAKLWSAFEATPPDFSSDKQQKSTLTSLPSLYAKYK